MSIRELSAKQRQVMTWWRPGSPFYGKEAIVCDGAVRSGKTVSMVVGFFLWSMASFSGKTFAIERNVSFGEAGPVIMLSETPRLRSISHT